MRRTSKQSIARLVVMTLAGCGLIALPALILSCAGSNRHRVLSFFFDGVPKPGESRPVGYAPHSRTKASRPFNRPTKRPAVSGVMYPHAPWAEQACTRCHRDGSMLLIRTVDEGLCQMCHREIPGNARYVHGPVAANACDLCHVRHFSARPKLLRDEPDALCLLCHAQGDQLEGDYHDGIELRSCVDCHDPHGGNNQYFVKPDIE